MTGLAILGGLLTALALVAFGRRHLAERWLYALSLIGLPVIYAGFALHAGEVGIGTDELLAGLPFLLGGAALAGAGRRHPVTATAAVAALWLLHGGYDAVHPQLFVNPGVPAWYPPYCASVDVAIGLYLGWLAWQLAQPPRNGVTSK